MYAIKEKRVGLIIQCSLCQSATTIKIYPNVWTHIAEFNGLSALESQLCSGLLALLEHTVVLNRDTSSHALLKLFLSMNVVTEGRPVKIHTYSYIRYYGFTTYRVPDSYY